jgi:hypothetical protein
MPSPRLRPRIASAVLGIVLAFQVSTTASMLLSFWILGLISWRVPDWVPLLGAASLFAIIGGGVLLGRPSPIGRWSAGVGLVCAAIAQTAWLATLGRPGVTIPEMLYLAAMILLSTLGIGLLARGGGVRRLR